MMSGTYLNGSEKICIHLMYINTCIYLPHTQNDEAHGVNANGWWTEEERVVYIYQQLVCKFKIMSK